MNHLLSHRVEVYDWDLSVVLLARNSDVYEVQEFIGKKLKLDKDELVPIEEIEGKTDGGSHYYNFNQRASIILLYPMTSAERFCNILGHEMQHVVDRVMDFCGVDDLEARAYLAGHLAEVIWTEVFSLKASVVLVKEG